MSLRFVVVAHLIHPIHAPFREVRKARFTPGRQRGKPVKVKFSLPICYKLD